MLEKKDLWDDIQEDIQKEESKCIENEAVQKPADSPEPEAPPGTSAAELSEGTKEEPADEDSAANELDRDEPEDMRQVFLEMRKTMQELRDEVKQLRVQIETGNYVPPPEPLGEPQTDGAVESSDKHSIRGEPPVKKKITVFSVIGNMLFYVVIVAVIFGAFLIRSSNTGRPAMFAGYSAFTVLTSSMEDVYPKGSLVVTKAVDANELKIGDDITFMISEESSVTHRIVEIDENFQGTGTRAFTTKGTTNQANDKDPVAAVNVVGKVIYHSKTLGDIAGVIRSNWPYLLFVMIVLIVLYYFLKRTFNSEEAGTNPSEKPKKSRKSSNHVAEVPLAHQIKTDNEERKIDNGE